MLPLAQPAERRVVLDRAASTTASGRSTGTRWRSSRASPTSCRPTSATASASTPSASRTSSAATRPRGGAVRVHRARVRPLACSSASPQVRLSGRMGDPLGTKRYCRAEQRARREVEALDHDAGSQGVVPALPQVARPRTRLATMGYSLDTLLAELDAVETTERPASSTTLKPLAASLGRELCEGARARVPGRPAASGACCWSRRPTDVRHRRPGARRRRGRAAVSWPHVRRRSSTAARTRRGVHTEPGVGLGIQRLRIIDLETGDQPIFNEDRSVVVVLNGEIYNFRELRERARGARPPVRDAGRHRGDRPPLRGARAPTA